MANPADDAAIEDAKFKAEMSRIDAGNVMTQLAEQNQQYKAGASQALAKGMVSLAMSGNTGFKDATNPDMPGAVGSTDPTQIAEMKTKLPTLLKELAATPETITVTTSGGGKNGEGGEGTTEKANPAYTELQSTIKEMQGQLAVVGGDSTPTIQDPSMLLKASGSDLLTMMNTREMMQRDLNTFNRSQKGAALTMLQNAGAYDTAAMYAEQTKNYNTMNTILGWGFKIAGAFIP